MSKLKELWTSESTTLGKILHTWVAGFLLLCSAIGAATEYIAVIPPDLVPQWLKYVIFGAGFISFVAGKLTKKPC